MLIFRSLPSPVFLFTRFFVLGWIYICILLSINASFGQDAIHYERLKSKGSIPADFLISTKDKFELLQEYLEETDTKATQEAKEAFYEGSAYYINQLLQSGKVLFNDPASEYVAEVGKYLLRGNPELRRQIRFYVVKSSAVNAFATNSGIILVNMGLLARLENEAQLAFVLAHEISHYTQKHPLDIFLQSRAIEKNSGSLFKPASLEEVLLAQNNYSKEKEFEADLFGWELFQTSSYSLDAIGGAFDILKYADKPFENIPVHDQFLTNDYVDIPTEYKLPTLGLKVETVNFIEGTHPDPDARNEKIQAKIKTYQDSKIRHLYLIGEDQFESVRTKARLECGFLDLLNQKYEEVLYRVFLLKEEYGHDLFLDKINLHALYALSKYTNAGKFWDIHKAYDTQPGALKQIAYLLEKLRPVELNILVISEHWKHFRAYEKDEEVVLQLEDLVKEFLTYYGEEYHTEILMGSMVDGNSLEGNEGKSDMVTDALSKLAKEADFVSFYQKISEQKKQDEGKLEEKAEREKTSKMTLKQSLRRFRDPRGLNLGLDRVIFVEPFYERIDSRSGQNEYLEQEEREQTFIKLLEKYSNELSLSHRMLSANDLQNNEVDVFNDLSLLDEWITEKIQYGDIKMVSVNHNEIQYLTQKYDCNHFVWTGSLALTRQRSGKFLVASAGFLLPILLPYSIYYATTPAHHTWYYTVVFDITTGEYLLQYPRLVRMKDKPDIVNATIYDLILQMKTRP